MKVCGSQQPERSARAAWCAPPARGSLRSGASVSLSSRASASTHQKPGVVAGGFVLGAGIAQADEQLDHGRCDYRAPKENGPPKWAVYSRAREEDYFFLRRVPWRQRLPWHRRPCRHPWRPCRQRASPRRRAPRLRLRPARRLLRHRRSPPKPAPGSACRGVTAVTPLGSLMSFRCSGHALLQAGQVDFDELGQVGRQAGDVQFGHHVVDQAVLELDGLRTLPRP